MFSDPHGLRSYAAHVFRCTSCKLMEQGALPSGRSRLTDGKYEKLIPGKRP
jgi:DNA-binding helix-hairpin-helix protein with protein kinase domain